MVLGQLYCNYLCFSPFRRIGYNYNASYFLFDHAWCLREELRIEIIIWLSEQSEKK